MVNVHIVENFDISIIMEEKGKVYEIKREMKRRGGG